MDRRLLFPVAISAMWTQTVAAQPPAQVQSEAEAALRARAQEFYQLEVDRKFRQAEAFVADDTKDYFFNNGKPDIRKFNIDKIELSPDGTKAKLTLDITSVMSAPGMAAMEFSSKVPTTWKLENEKWVWYLVQEGEVDTPFGKMRVGSPNAGPAPALPASMPDPSKIRSLVAIDRTSVELVAGSHKAEAVTITNHMPGSIDISAAGDGPKGLVMLIDKNKVGPEEKAVVSFSARDNETPSGTVHLNAGPLQVFSIQIHTK